MAPDHGKYTLVAEDEAPNGAHTTQRRLGRSMAAVVGVALCGAAAAVVLLAASDALPSTALRTQTSGRVVVVDRVAPWPTEGKQFTLKTYPVLVEDGGDLVVSWEGEAAAPLTSRDFLTLSCGPTTGEGDYLLKKGVKETDADDHSVRFSELYMLRCNYTAVYFNYQEDSGKYKAIAKVEAGMKEPFVTPKHGHLSLTDDETAMAVMFNTASSKTPMVKYGENPQALKYNATGTSTTYGADDLCHAPANVLGQRAFRDPGFMHTVIMKDLKPDTYYYYQYGHAEHGLSHVRRFKSRPPKSSKYANFIAYADMGTYVEPGSASTAGRVYEDVVGGGYDSFLLHFGDISYARSVGYLWDQFFHMIEPYATRLPYMVGIGNHEYDYTTGGKHDLSGGMLPYGGSFNPSWGNFGIDSAGECGVPMHHRWHAPKTGNWIYWYSFDYGGIHIIQMSTEHNWTRGSEQYEWLQHDLEQVDRSVTPWVVLTAHRMMYTTQMNIEPDMKVSYKFQEEVENLIYNHRVNLMMVGHEHAYERSCPLYRKKCVADGKGTVHVVVGSAGYPLGTEDFSSKYGNWSLRHVNDYGYLRIASSPEDMRVQFVLNKNGNVYDEFTIEPWE
ncbi:putative calcineurin-like phosphoesterase [Phytophthora cinnamomi]|uniref:putative calcineurin-like phosphoesterase n=1 Tax=Phytophthora cinnamomi TaxID=4785 RepID=UPI00355A2112|nr:putative calcineurin-like phosphoesterase [Phytophthora cinnamomi]